MCTQIAAKVFKLNDNMQSEAVNREGDSGGIFKKCVNSQAVYLLSEQHGLEAQERR